MSKTVLICDDDQDILEVTKMVLELRGFEVATASDCTNIVELVSNLKPGVILMDLWIPEEGGAAATRLLKATPETRDIPVILFSANNNLAKVVDECGADDYLQKPYNIDDLENKVAQLLQAAY